MARIVLILLIFLVNGTFSGQRGLWIVRNSLLTQNDLQKLRVINRELKLTDIYFQVRALGANYFPPRHSKDKLGLNDILNFCKQHQIRFHAWINAFYIWSGTPLPDEKNHSVWQDADHLITDTKGHPYRYAVLKRSGAEGYFVDPEAPLNIRQINKLIKFLLGTDGIKGIHFDYFRMPPNPIHFSNYLRSRFLSLYYVDPARLERYSNEYFSIFGIDSYRLMNERYQSFLQKEFLNRLKEWTDLIKTAKKNIEVSVAVKPDIKVAREEYAQDWAAWLNEKACDYVIAMNYSTDFNVFKKNLIMAKSIQRDGQIVIGIGAYHLQAAQLAIYIREVETMGFGGVCLFSFSTLKEKPELLENITAMSFNN